MKQSAVVASWKRHENGRVRKLPQSLSSGAGGTSSPSYKGAGCHEELRDTRPKGKRLRPLRSSA
eukprot:1217551-Amphidinium_carterae.1